MKSKIVYILIINVLIFGCTSVELTPQGRSVKLVEMDFVESSHCEKIETILYENNLQQGSESAQVVIKKIKNMVGETSGNTAASSYNILGRWDPEGTYHQVPLLTRIPVNVFKCKDPYWKKLVSM